MSERKIEEIDYEQRETYIVTQMHTTDGFFTVQKRRLKSVRLKDSRTNKPFRFILKNHPDEGE